MGEQKLQDVSMTRVQALFKKSGMSLHELGLRMGYPAEIARQSAFQFMKSGDPRISTLRRFAKALGIPLRELLARHGSGKSSRTKQKEHDMDGLPLDDCFFCMTMKPGTRFIPLMDLPLPKGTKIPVEFQDAEFLICPDCDAQGTEWKEARMQTQVEGEQTMARWCRRYVWPFRAKERSDGMWVIRDAKNKELDGLESPDKEKVDAVILAFGEWRRARSM